MRPLERILESLSGDIRYNAALNHLTWFKVGGAAEVLYKPSSTDDLAKLIRQNNNEIAVTVIGAGSNLIIRDGGVEGIVVKLGRGFTDMEIISEREIAVGAACLDINLAAFCRECGIKGLEFLIGIPGTVGGGVRMNAGAYGSEFKDIITKVEGVDREGNVTTILAQDLKFGYRHTSLPEGFIVTRVFFKAVAGNSGEIADLMQEISRKRASTQPITEKTGGSTFANPEGYKAWQLIDQAGMRGQRVGEAEMSKLHCNFMINKGNATAADLENLGASVRRKVLETTGIGLEWEIKIIGKKQ